MYTVTLKSGKTSVITANDRGLLTRIAISMSECLNCKWDIKPNGNVCELTVATRISGPRLQSIIDKQCNPNVIELEVL